MGTSVSPWNWAMMYGALSDFWWQHVVPGKHAIAAGDDPERYRPLKSHPMTEDLKRRSRRLADLSEQQRFTPSAMRPESAVGSFRYRSPRHSRCYSTQQTRSQDACR